MGFIMKNEMKICFLRGFNILKFENTLNVFVCVTIEHG